MDMLKAMEVYVSVVEHGSLAGAAGQLRASSAAISRQLTMLERRLGARLLHRTTRRISLSQAGQNFYARARQVLADVQEAEAAVGLDSVQPCGLLRVAAPVHFGMLELSRVLPEFRAAYPELHIDLDLSDRLIDLVHDGIDVAVRIAGALDPALVARRIAPVRIVTCAAPSYLDRRGWPREPDELSQHDTLCYSLLAKADHWTFVDDRGQSREVRLNPTVRANNSEVLRQLALAGGGVIAAPDFMLAADLRSGRLTPVLPGWARPEASLHAVYPSRKHLSDKVRVFIDFLVRKFGATENHTGPVG